MQAPAAQNGADQGLSLDGGRVRGEPGEAEEDRSKVDDLRGTPMSVGNLEELIDENHAIVSSSVGPEYYVGILSFVDKDQLEPGCSILMHTKVLSVVGILHDEVDPMVSVMKVEKAPLEPPKGVILYGEPGTGKTLLPKKYLRDGPKLVRELFRVADDLSPSIVFIDEIDAVGMMPNSGDVKVILATNRIESLDPALLRPGRIDRKIEFPLPDIKTRRRIFQIHTSKMTLSEDVNLEEFVMTKDEFSGADIKAICTEAGLRMKVTHPDFKKAKEKVMFKKKEGIPEGSSSSSSSTRATNPFVLAFRKSEEIAAFLDKREEEDAE
uniref:AAA+ ATPase domain-containing protein n=1 Tax=Brassica campestris TaxID=3711 RepID=M4E5W1_BRACM